jgi:integrase
MRCTWKTVFLLALASSNRRSELQALSRAPRDLIFSDSGMYLRTVPGFLAKTAIPTLDPAPFFIPALTPFSGRDTEDRLLCPVRMVRYYLEFTGGPSAKQRLFQKVRGDGPPTAQTISNWIRDTVKFAHQHRPDLPVTAHQVRRMSTSWAFHGGSHSVEEIIQAGTWAGHSTFTSFYLADVRLQPDGRRRMHPVVARKQLQNF